MAFERDPRLSAVAGDNYRQCPKGHALPRHTSWGHCNPLHCADDVKALDVVPVATGDSSSSDQLSKAAKEGIVDSAKKALRRRSRERLVAVPEFKDAADAEDWVNRKKAELLPYALAEKEYKLLYGNDDQRDKASDYFLDAMGHGKKESGLGTGATIILMGVKPEDMRPWAAPRQVLPAKQYTALDSPTTVEALPAVSSEGEESK